MVTTSEFDIPNSYGAGICKRKDYIINYEVKKWHSLKEVKQKTI